MSFSETVRDPCSSVNEAARSGNKESLLSLIQTGHPVDVSDNRGWKPTHEAASGNFLECLQLLLDHEATDANWQSFEGSTALLTAAREGHLEAMRLLLEYGAEPDLADSMSEYPLLAAVKSEKAECVKLLLDFEADVNCQLYCGTSPLHQAASEGMEEILKLLLEHDAKLDIREEYDITPLFSAAQYGHANCLKLLLEKAKNTDPSLVNSPADDGATPLFLASQEGNTDCVQLLLEYGADANLKTKEPVVLPLHAALQFNRIECVQKLLQVTDQQEFPECEVSPFYYSMMEEDGQCTQCLLEAGVDANYRHLMPSDDVFRPKIFRYVNSALCFDCEVTPLAMVGLYGYSQRNAQILLDGGARVNASHDKDVPPLLTALDAGDLDLTTLLIDHGASLNLYHLGATGNMTVLICLHNWKALNFVLKAGAEAVSLLSDPQCCTRSSLGALGGTERMFAAAGELQGLRMPLNQITSAMSQSANSAEDQLATLRDVCGQLTASVARVRAAALHLEESTEQLAAFLRMDAPKLLMGARYLMSKGDVTISQVVQRILEFVGNVQLNPTLESLMASKQEWTTLLSVTESPRPLAHYARLAVREQLTPSQLISDTAISTLPLPSTVLDYVKFNE